MIYYFTGTGNSLWTAKRWERNWANREISRRYAGNAACKCGDERDRLCVSHLHGDLPWLCKKILLTAKLNPESYLFLVMTSSGGTSGKRFFEHGSGPLLHRLPPCAAFDLQMPGNCVVSSDCGKRRPPGRRASEGANPSPGP
jgi:hypothetical protein